MPSVRTHGDAYRSLLCAYLLVCVVAASMSLSLIFSAVAGIYVDKSYQVDSNKTSFRYALVLGNWEYEYVEKLKGAKADLKEISTTLSKLGFIVTVAMNTSKAQADGIVEDFIASLDRPSAILIYFSGHGAENGGLNYFMPIDFPVDSVGKNLSDNTVVLQDVLEKLTNYNSIPKIVFADVCRTALGSTPADGSDAKRKKIKFTNTFIGYATAAGGFAIDDNDGNGGLFTRALIEELNGNTGSIFDVFSSVISKVQAGAEYAQIPWQNSSLSQPFFFHQTLPSTPPPAPVTFSQTNAPTVPAATRSADQVVVPQADWKIVVIFAFGVLFVIVILVLAFAFPNPTEFQYTVSRIILALSTASVGTLLTGFLEVQIPDLLKAGGALAIFVVVYFYSPAKLISKPPASG